MKCQHAIQNYCPPYPTMIPKLIVSRSRKPRNTEKKHKFPVDIAFCYKVNFILLFWFSWPMFSFFHWIYENLWQQVGQFGWLGWSGTAEKTGPPCLAWLQSSSIIMYKNIFRCWIHYLMKQKRQKMLSTNNMRWKYENVWAREADEWRIALFTWEDFFWTTSSFFRPVVLVS